MGLLEVDNKRVRFCAIRPADSDGKSAWVEIDGGAMGWTIDVAATHWHFLYVCDTEWWWVREMDCSTAQMGLLPVGVHDTWPSAPQTPCRILWSERGSTIADLMLANETPGRRLEWAGVEVVQGAQIFECGYFIPPGVPHDSFHCPSTRTPETVPPRDKWLLWLVKNGTHRFLAAPLSTIGDLKNLVATRLEINPLLLSVVVSQTIPAEESSLSDAGLSDLDFFDIVLKGPRGEGDPADKDDSDGDERGKNDPPPADSPGGGRARPRATPKRSQAKVGPLSWLLLWLGAMIARSIVNVGGAYAVRAAVDRPLASRWPVGPPGPGRLPDETWPQNVSSPNGVGLSKGKNEVRGPPQLLQVIHPMGGTDSHSPEFIEYLWPGRGEFGRTDTVAKTPGFTPALPSGRPISIAMVRGLTRGTGKADPAKFTWSGLGLASGSRASKASRLWDKFVRRSDPEAWAASRVRPMTIAKVASDLKKLYARWWSALAPKESGPKMPVLRTRPRLKRVSPRKNPKTLVATVRSLGRRMARWWFPAGPRTPPGRDDPRRRSATGEHRPPLHNATRRTGPPSSLGGGRRKATPQVLVSTTGGDDDPPVAGGGGEACRHVEAGAEGGASLRFGTTEGVKQVQPERPTLLGCTIDLAEGVKQDYGEFGGALFGPLPRLMTFYVGPPGASDSFVVKCFHNTEFGAVRGAISAAVGERVSIYDSCGKFLEDDRTPLHYNLYDHGHLRLGGRLLGGTKEGRAGGGGRRGESRAPDEEANGEGSETEGGEEGCGVIGCKKQHSGLRATSMCNHLRLHLAQAVPDETAKRWNLTRCGKCAQLCGARTILWHKARCPQIEHTKTRKEDARRMGGDEGDAERPAEGDVDMGPEDVEAVQEEDFAAPDLIKGGRDTPITSCPAGLSLLQDLATSLLNNLAKKMREDNPAGTRIHTEALFDLPVILADREGGPASRDDVYATLVRLTRSLVPASEVSAEAKGRREGRKSPSPHRSGVGRGNGSIAEGDGGLQKAVDKAEKMVKGGRLSAAINCLEAHLTAENGKGPTPDREEVNRALRTLHPAAAADDHLHGRPLPTGHVLTVESVQKAIDSAPRGSAAAMSGWTFDLMRQLGEDTPKGRDFVASLTDVYNLILQGKGGNPDIWIRARIVALPKPLGGVRPIAVGEVLTRLMNRALAADLGGVIGKKMAPLQWGVGVRGGAEVVSHGVQLAHDAILTALDGRPEVGSAGAETEDQQQTGDEDTDPLTVWSTDIANAFNELRRRVTSDALIESEEGRSLARLFHWSYGKKAALLHGDGTLACYSETGMRQGDPLGPLFFSLGYWRSVLKEAAGAFPDVTFLAYIDDTYFICRRSQGVRVLNFLQHRMAKVGLRLSLGANGKVVCLDPSPGASPGTKAGGYQVVTDGIKVLGGPVSFGISAGCGDATFRAKFLDKELKKCTSVLEVLHSLSAQPAYWLLAQCVNARVSYLCRISAPWLIARHLNDFDDRVDACLAKIIDLPEPLPAIACIIRGLPGKLGGGCIRRSRDVSACGFSASFLNAMFIIQESCPILWGQVWASKRNPILPHCGILSRTVPYFVGFTENGSQWARPSTDEEIFERMEAEDDDHQVQPGAERRPSTVGPRADSHLEALVIMRKLLTQGRSDIMDEGISVIRESQAVKAGFANSGDKDAWIALMDDAEDHLDDYEHFRCSPRASKRGRETVAEFGQVRQGDWAVTERVPYRWRQSGLQAFRDLCQFARAARMLPGDSGYRASFLSSERVGGSAHLQYGSEEADSWDNQLFLEALKQTLHSTGHWGTGRNDGVHMQ